jgi:hypothetical protein
MLNAKNNIPWASGVSPWPDFTPCTPFWDVRGGVQRVRGNLSEHMPESAGWDLVKSRSVSGLSQEVPFKEGSLVIFRGICVATENKIINCRRPPSPFNPQHRTTASPLRGQSLPHSRFLPLPVVLIRPTVVRSLRSLRISRHNVRWRSVQCSRANAGVGTISRKL